MFERNRTKRWVGLPVAAAIALMVAPAAGAAPRFTERSVSGEPGTVTFKFTETGLTPGARVRYRLSAAYVTSVWVTPWGGRDNWHRDSTSAERSGDPRVWAPSRDYSARANNNGVVKGWVSMSNERLADPTPAQELAGGYLLSHYTIYGAAVEDLDNGLRRRIPSYRIRCEDFSEAGIKRSRALGADPEPMPCLEERPTRL